MNEEDKKAFMQDFKDADIDKKLDMWYFSLDQESLWEELLDEMSKIARIKQLQGAKGKTGSAKVVEKDE